MNIYKIDIVTKKLEESSNRMIIRNFSGFVQGESKKFVRDHIKYIYKFLEIDPTTVEYFEIKEA